MEEFDGPEATLPRDCDAAQSPSAAERRAVEIEPSDLRLAGLVFGRVVARASAEGTASLTEALGLSRADLCTLIARHLPDLVWLADALPADAGRGADAIEESDYRAYLLECRAGIADEEETWLATIIARRSLAPNHLWQDMGFANRDELSATLGRYFPELVRRNASDMKWKKFIYRQLCERDGVLVCKSPNCETCSDFAVCFGGEDGEPLATLAHLGRGSDTGDPH